MLGCIIHIFSIDDKLKEKNVLKIEQEYTRTLYWRMES